MSHAIAAVRSSLSGRSCLSAISDEQSIVIAKTMVLPSRTYASVPRPKVTDVTNSDEWTVSAAVPSKPDAKASSNVVDLASTAPSQPFCDPPIKATDPDAKHTFKETEQDVVMLPTDLNKNATVSVKQLCDYYTRLSKKNLTSTMNEPDDDSRINERIVSFF